MMRYMFGFLLFCLFQADNANPLGEMSPNGNEIYLKGSTVEITCKMNESYNLSDLHFKVTVTKNLSGERNLEAEELIIDSRTKMYRIINAPAMEAHIDCKLGKYGINRVTVNIGTPPTNVIDFKCRSYHWENLTCSFEKPDNPVAPIYKLFYIVDTKPKPSSEPTNECTLNPDFNKKFTCLINNEPSNGIYRQSLEYYLFRLVAENRLGNKTENFVINNFNSVIPAAPDNLTAVNLTSDSAVLTFNIPGSLSLLQRQFVYMINYTSEYDKPKWIELPPNKTTKLQKQVLYAFKNLPYAHAWYDVRVWLKVKDAPNLPEMWSNFSYFTFQTTQRTPDKPPQTDIGAFSSTDSGRVSVYWKALKECEQNGKNFNYTVIETNNPKTKPIKLDKTMAKFEEFNANTMQETLNFQIYSGNEVGRSQLPSSIRVPPADERCEYPINIKKIRVNDTYNLSWDAPTKGPKIESYTLFWCESPNELPDQCKGSIDFERVDSHVFEYQLKTSSTMNFAISANSMNSSSGMIWAKCTVIPGDDNIKKLTTMYILRTGPTFIEFKWNLECFDRTILEGYILEYCPISDPKTEVCNEPKSFNISKEVEQYKLEGLKPFTTYKTRIRMVSDINLGPWSDSLVNLTAEAAPSPIRNLRASNTTNSSVALTWDDPEVWNGAKQKYTIGYNNLWRYVDKEASHTPEHPFILDGLESFTMYEIVVMACTGACSDKSNTIQIQTGIGFPSTMLQPSISKDNNVLVWQPPQMKRGHLQYYELKVENNGKSRMIKINGTKCTLMHSDFCNIVNGKLYISVRAVNVLHSAHAKKETLVKYGSVMKRDLAQILSDSDSGHSKNSNTDSNVFKRHSKAEIDADRRPFNTNNKIDDTLKISDKDHSDGQRMSNVDFDNIKICQEENDLELEKYFESDKYQEPLPGNWSASWSTQCPLSTPLGFYFMLIFLIIFSMAFVYFTYFAVKKVNKMKDLDIQLPPGLEDIKDETKGKHLDGGINTRDDIVHTLDMHSREEQSLLRMESASSNSSENNSQCEYNEGIDNSTEYDQHTEDDSVQTMSENLDIEKCSPTPLLPVHININTSPGKIRGDQSSPQSLIHMTSNESLRSPMLQHSSFNGGFTPAPAIARPVPTVTSNGYVTHDAIMSKKPVSSGYTPWSAVDARQPQTETTTSTQLHDDVKTKTPIIVSTDIQGISGYVTHKQLSDFGQLMH